VQSFRATATSANGRFLAAIRTGSGGPPALGASALATSGDMEGALIGGDAVLFSKRPFGQAPALGFSYTVPRSSGRVHTLVDMSGSVDIAFSQTATDTTVTVSSGSGHAASAEGVVSFTEP
jgi:hypothetical protein